MLLHLTNAALPVVCGLGIFLRFKATNRVFSGSTGPGVANLWQKTKEALFPETTNYR
jgi:hypothetical protein